MITAQKTTPSDLVQITQFLKSTTLFGKLSPEELERLAAGAKLSLKKKGSIIYQKDDSSSYLYLIKSGYVVESVYYGASVDVLVKVRSAGEYFGEMGILSSKTYPNTAIALEDTCLIAISRSAFLDTIVLVKVRSAGEYFGEMGILSSKTYPNTAIALEDTCLIAISRSAFLDTIWNNTSVCRVIILELIERLNNSAQNMVNSMYLDASGRLAFTLVNLTTNNRQKCMNIRVTQSALAASSGMARQTAAKILGEWRRQGIISTERGRLCILDLDALLDIILNSEIEG